MPPSHQRETILPAELRVAMARASVALARVLLFSGVVNVRAAFAFIVCVGACLAAVAQEPVQPPTLTYPGVTAEPDATYQAAPPQDDSLRYGLSLALDGAHALADSAAGLGFSASAFVVFHEPLALTHLGLSVWPDGLRAGRGEHALRRNHEIFVGASIYPFDVDVLHFGAYLLLSLVNIGDNDPERGTLGLSVLWAINERFGVRYQLGASTNFVDVALVSSLNADVRLF